MVIEVCGGGQGSFPTATPTKSAEPTSSSLPSSQPTTSLMPSKTCEDVNDWIDSWGDGCSWYAGSDNYDDFTDYCLIFGEAIGLDDLTENEIGCISM